MKTTKRCFFIVVLFLSMGKIQLHAQDCPPPLNFHIEIENSMPPVAHLTWDAAPGGQTTGYQLIYSIDHQTPVVLILPLTPESYDLVLPEDWESVEAELTAICENGYSNPAKVKKANIIIIDLVLVRTSGEAEMLVCSNICPDATHFNYSIRPPAGQDGASFSLDGLQGTSPTDIDDSGAADDPYRLESGDNNLIMLYNISRFCGCMDASGNHFEDVGLVGACKNKSRDYFDPNLYNLYSCTTISSRSNLPALSHPGVEVWPSPFRQSFYIRLDAAFETGTLRLLDAKGRLILSRELNRDDAFQPLALNLAGAPSGMYFYAICMAGGQYWSGKVIKE